jgi:hypothetical protein
VPHRIVLIEPGTIEKTSSGKLRRSAVRASFIERTLKKLAEG